MLEGFASSGRSAWTQLVSHKQSPKLSAYIQKENTYVRRLRAVLFHLRAVAAGGDDVMT